MGALSSEAHHFLRMVSARLLAIPMRSLLLPACGLVGRTGTVTKKTKNETKNGKKRTGGSVSNVERFWEKRETHDED